MKILVVDDDNGIRQSIRRTLVRECRADVSEAANGLEAVARLMRGPCDLVLLDINMPDMDGIKTLQAIRRSPTRKALPVIMLTGTAEEAKVREARRLGIDGYLLKPVQPDVLVRRLAEALAKSSKVAAESGHPPAPLLLRPRDHVLVVEPDPALLGFVATRLSRFCRVDRAPSPAAGMEACREAPPAAVFLGGPDDSAGNALFLAEIRNDPRTAEVPVFALVAPERTMLSEAHLGVDAVLPRTLDEAVWNRAAVPVLGEAAEGARYLAAAVGATRLRLADLMHADATARPDVRKPGLRRWISTRIDFEAADTPWSLALLTTSVSADRLVRTRTPDHQGPVPESAGILEVSTLAQGAFDAIGKLESADGQGAPRCEARASSGPPALPTGATLAGEEWVLVLQYEILVLVRIERRFR